MCTATPQRLSTSARNSTLHPSVVFPCLVQAEAAACETSSCNNIQPAQRDEQPVDLFATSVAMSRGAAERAALPEQLTGHDRQAGESLTGYGSQPVGGAAGNRTVVSDSEDDADGNSGANQAGGDADNDSMHHEEDIDMDHDGQQVDRSDSDSSSGSDGGDDEEEQAPRDPYDGDSDAADQAAAEGAARRTRHMDTATITMQQAARLPRAVARALQSSTPIAQEHLEHLRWQLAANLAATKQAGEDAVSRLENRGQEQRTAELKLQKLGRAMKQQRRTNKAELRMLAKDKLSTEARLSKARTALQELIQNQQQQQDDFEAYWLAQVDKEVPIGEPQQPAYLSQMRRPASQPLAPLLATQQASAQAQAHISNHDAGHDAISS